MPGYTLYGAEVSYFTGKARAYLRWRSVDFDEVLSTREVFRDIILPKVGWPVIPVAAMPDGEIVQDTADIIAHVEAREPLKPSVQPEGPLQRFVGELLHLYADEWLVIPAMHYRWTYCEEWAYAEFGALSAPDVSPAEQLEIGRAMGQMFRGMTPMLGVTPETIPGIEASYEAFLADFSRHLEAHPFLLGGRATLADFAFIGPLYAHLLRDPYPGELMRRIAPRVAEWTARTHAGAKDVSPLPADDSVPETLLPILQRQMREQLPALQATIALFASWLESAAPGADLPRGFGMIPISIEGRTAEAAARAFPLYRLQGALDAYAALDPATKARADALLSEAGSEVFTSLRLPARLTRRNYRLALA
ncbi:MAG TPA: glutathione S-transferase C-terminal domain-containing protein [Hyphomonas sp.]|nr:glutathione S-transferase family protein [Hyphomonas sp.]MCA8904314.1 glutathione S-transferase family protein [Hyphomonas sp.]MCB9972163.1 glutathione S-transferase family protein [Hyphomonas sp.]HPE49674.1 glutathione S-transferase C-terminal domain-containing protein [Hyphomonas sp.]